MFRLIENRLKDRSRKWYEGSLAKSIGGNPDTVEKALIDALALHKIKLGMNGNYLLNNKHRR